MSTLSTKLQLIVPAESDQFRTSDFVTNWGILDSHPGISTVANLSTPGTFDGQTVYNTGDNLLHVWDAAHSVWRSPTTPLVWHFAASPSFVLSNGTTTTGYTSSIVNFTVPTAISVALSGTVTLYKRWNDTGSSGNVQLFTTVSASALIDGSSVSGARWNSLQENYNGGSTFPEQLGTPFDAEVIALTAGNHALSVTATAGQHATGYTAEIISYRLNLIAVQKGVGSQ